MKLIFKYLKPYIVSVIAVILLTFVQVQTELALPDYMADIVTNGIQYGGVVETIPQVIKQKDLDEMLLFVNDSDKKIVLDNYQKISSGTVARVKNQEIKFNEDVYIFNENYDSKVNDILNEPLVYTYLLSQSGTEVTSDNIEQLKPLLIENAQKVQDNYSAIASLRTKDLYKEVGLSTETIQNNYIISIGLKMLGISLIGVVVQLLSTYLSTIVSSKIAAKMRRDVFEKVESFSSSEFSRFSTASLITRTSNDITKLQGLIQMMMRMMLMSPMMGITAVIKVAKYPSISWVLLVAIAFIVACLTVILIFVVPKFEVIQKLTDRINNVMREFLDGMLPIRAFNAQKAEEEKFDKTNKEITSVDLFVSRITGLMIPVVTLVMNGLTVVVIWVAAKQIDMDVMSVGNMLAFLQYAMHVVISFMLVAATFFIIPRALVSAKRINEVLETKLTIVDKENPEELPDENGILEFENVGFRYPGAEEQVLENISFTAKPGETVAFIGSTGSGKSTIVKLIPRLFDVSEGRILYCGKDIRNVKQAELHNKIGYATQKAILFTGDIESNIKFGRDVSDEEVEDAIDISQSRDIINENENGKHFEIAQGGTNVSGGQKQRISISRTLAQNKQLYIFDDTFSALDYATDKKLRGELDKLIKKTKATVIIVAQRISTIKNADKIIVLDSGKIAGEGKHSELLKSCKIYQEIANSQLTKEELENA